MWLKMKTGVDCPHLGVIDIHVQDNPYLLLWLSQCTQLPVIYEAQVGSSSSPRNGNVAGGDDHDQALTSELESLRNIFKVIKQAASTVQ